MGCDHLAEIITLLETAPAMNRLARKKLSDGCTVLEALKQMQPAEDCPDCPDGCKEDLDE